MGKEKHIPEKSSEAGDITKAAVDIGNNGLYNSNWGIVGNRRIDSGYEPEVEDEAKMRHSHRLTAGSVIEVGLRHN